MSLQATPDYLWKAMVNIGVGFWGLEERQYLSYLWQEQGGSGELQAISGVMCASSLIIWVIEQSEPSASM